MRKILIFIIILLILGTGIFYFFSVKKQVAQTGEPVTFKDFFPLGGNRNDQTQPEGQLTETPQTTSSLEKSRFTQITPGPIAGYTVFTRTKKVPSSTDPKKEVLVTETILGYVSRQNGFVYEKINDGQASQVTNIFIPNIYEALFMDNNQTVLLRSLAQDGLTIQTYQVPIPSENPDGTRTQKEGVFLPNNLKTVATNPTSSVLATSIERTADASVVTSTSAFKEKKELLLSPLKEILLSWQGQTLFAQTKAAAETGGFLFRINKNTKRFERVLGEIKGLTTLLSPSGTWVLFSETRGKSFGVSLFNTKKNTVENIGLAILPEKCAWYTNEDLLCAGNSFVEEQTYPDAWYAGIVHFSDQIYRIYTQSGVFDVLYDNTQESFDMTALQINETAGILYFIDKKTGVLWGFNV